MRGEFDEYIEEWLVLGPFFPDDLETDLLADVGSEANVNPREGDTVTTSDGRRLTWEKYNCSKSQVIDFVNAVGDYEYATAYAFCILQSEVACDAEVYLQNTGRIALWIKGKQLHCFSSHANHFFDGRTLVVSLKAGANWCFARVNRARRDWNFGLRMIMLHPDSAIISGTVTDENGGPVFGAHIHLEQDGRRIASASSDPSGRYRMNVYPVNAPYDLAATSGSLGVRQSNVQVVEKEHRTLDLTLEEAVSVEGTMLMLDNATPHVAIPVQAIHDGMVVAATFSDEAGKYQFANLRPGLYQVRCQVPGGYVCYGEERGRERESQRAGKPEGRTSSGKPMSLQVGCGKTLTGIDFRFAPFKKGTWRSYDTLDGLAHDAVRDMCRDRNGLMWFATEGGGVSCYDGKDFVNFTTRDGLAHNIVRSAYADEDGTVWFGTEGGVSRYDGREFVNLTSEDGLVYNGVHDIYHHPDGVMWFATWGGVSRYDGRTFRNFTTKDGLVDNRVDVICPDHDGVMWFGTFWGVSRYDGREFANLNLKDGLVGRWVRSIHRDPDGAIWFGTGWGGVSRYDGEEFVNLTTRDGLADNDVCSIHQDPDGVMWFGTEGGVSRYDGRGMGDCPHFVNFTKKDGLASNCVNAIHRDPDGVMWFATGSIIDRDDRGGVSVYDEKSFVSFTIKDGLAHNTVNSIYPDSDGVMWFATKGGASRYDGKRFANFTIRDGLLSDWIRAIHSDPDGVVWFATGPGPWGRHGISRYDGRGMGDFPHFVNFTAEDGLTEGWVNAICRDPDGVMWFATGYWMYGGISRYDGAEFTNLTTKDGLPSNWVRAIHRDPDGVMWFGTQEGLSQYDGRHFVNFTTKDGLANDSIFAIHRDPDGIMWFATWGGVSRYNGREFINLTVEDGLANDMAVAIHQEPGGDMWFGTHAGVSRYNGVAWTSLDARDGLAGKSVSSICQDSDGTLWFATEDGITLYRRSTVPPGIRIVSMKINGEDTDLEAIPPIIVGSHVSIEYSAIDFKTIPEKRQYCCCVYETQDSRHKTQDKEDKTRGGFESRVLSPGSEVYNHPTRDTAFDWIPEKPGTYTFQVQAIDRDLNYSEPATLNLTVQPDPVIVSMQTELNHLRREVVEKYHFENIIGRSASIRQVRALMDRAIDSGLTALIIGETGTGKELVAKAIHYNSPRKGKPLLARNCGAIPKDLLASDLFGHRKGAFTGATEDKMGLFEAASGGTVLLDEISEMPEEAQIHLLRVLQEREVQRLGEYTSREVDIRIIAMTNRDLAEEVKADRFREDLYHRLNEFPIHIPPLREHSEDIPLLAEHFLNEYSQEQKQEAGSFAPDAFDVLQSYTWPGNVRELRNVVRRAAALAEEGAQIQTYHFPPQITHGESLIQKVLSDQLNYTDSVTRFRRRFIEEILRECDGNRSEAARRLGMDRSNLRNLMKRLGVKE